MTADAPEGVVVVDKPAGPTSFDVAARVRRLFGGAKVGHTGTLDPLATGVLAVCVGEAVKLQQFLADGDKAYLATVAFGVATSTEDAEGEVTARADASAVDAAAVRAALPALVGTLWQVPPMYSAVRVGGRRLHEAARAGEAVERAPRQVRVDALELVEIAAPRDGVVQARLAVRCGKGTYVRTLAVDLGRSLGVPAHLAALRRTAAGPFRLEEATPLEALERLAPDRATLRALLVPPGEALRGWPALHLTPGQARDLGHGKAIEAPLADGPCRALGPGGALVAVCDARGGVVRPVRVLRPIR